MQSPIPARSNAAEVDVALPLQHAAVVDVDLPMADLADLAAMPLHTGLNNKTLPPTMSQAAANVSRVRWPNRSRAGYHGGSPWNWMRDGRAGFGERSIGGV